MSEIISITKDDGTIVQEQVNDSGAFVMLSSRRLVAVSDNIARITSVTSIALNDNALAAIPAGVFAMKQVKLLLLYNNRLTSVPRDIARLTALSSLYLEENRIVSLPREIGSLRALTFLSLSRNALTSVPSELGVLHLLQLLSLDRNALSWLPLALDRLPVSTRLYLDGNPLPIDVGDAEDDDNAVDSRANLPSLFAATSHVLAVIRDEASTLAIGLQDLDLPALVTLEIVDAAFPNSIPMHLKWSLITAVKHFH